MVVNGNGGMVNGFPFNTRKVVPSRFRGQVPDWTARRLRPVDRAGVFLIVA